MIFNFSSLIIFGRASFPLEEIAIFRFLIWCIIDDDSDDNDDYDEIL